MWRAKRGPSSGNQSLIRASKPESGCGAPPTICGCRWRLASLSRRNSLHRKQQGWVSHRGTTRRGRCESELQRLKPFLVSPVTAGLKPGPPKESRFRARSDNLRINSTECAKKCVVRILSNRFGPSYSVSISILPPCLCVSVAMFLSACGYHVGGTSSRLPPGLKVIAVPALENRTTQYRVEQRMTQAVVREFLARTKYRIVSTEDLADAVLHGEIMSVESSPVVFDTTPMPNTPTNPTATTTTARATTMLVSVRLKVLLEERETKKILYKNDNYLFGEAYEISTNPTTFFDEQGPALDRMARDFASRLVADVVENF